MLHPFPEKALAAVIGRYKKATGVDLGAGGAGEHGCLAVHSGRNWRQCLNKPLNYVGRNACGQPGHGFSQDLQNGAGRYRRPGYRPPYPGGGDGGVTRSEDRGRKTEVGRQRSEDRGRKTEVGRQRSEDRERKTEVGRQRTEDRGRRPRSEDRERKTEVGRRTEDRERKPEDRWLRTEFRYQTSGI
jgi:hypothetical protein